MVAEKGEGKVGEDKVGEGGFNKPGSKVKPCISRWISNMDMSIGKVVLRYKCLEKEDHGKTK